MAAKKSAELAILETFFEARLILILSHVRASGLGVMGATTFFLQFLIIDAKTAQFWAPASCPTNRASFLFIIIGWIVLATELKRGRRRRRAALLAFDQVHSGMSVPMVTCTTSDFPRHTVQQNNWRPKKLKTTKPQQARLHEIVALCKEHSPDGSANAVAKNRFGHVSTQQSTQNQLHFRSFGTPRVWTLPRPIGRCLRKLLASPFATSNVAENQRCQYLAATNQTCSQLWEFMRPNLCKSKLCTNPHHAQAF
jgi:hypothetical protein